MTTITSQTLRPSQKWYVRKKYEQSTNFEVNAALINIEPGQLAREIILQKPSSCRHEEQSHRVKGR